MSNIVKRIFLFDQHTCPWWLAYSWDHRLRKLIHNPETLLKPIIQPGDKIIDLGCGMGYFSIAMAEYTGKNGIVYAVDIQEKMLAVMNKRIRNTPVKQIIQPILSNTGADFKENSVDLILSFWMFHEVENKSEFLARWLSYLKPKGHYLLVEPRIHTSGSQFDAEISLCTNIGLSIEDYPKTGLSRAVLFKKE